MFAYSRFLGWNMNNMIGRRLRCIDSCLVIKHNVKTYRQLHCTGFFGIPEVKQINLSKYVCPGLVAVPLKFA